LYWNEGWLVFVKYPLKILTRGEKLSRSAQTSNNGRKTDEKLTGVENYFFLKFLRPTFSKVQEGNWSTFFVCFEIWHDARVHQREMVETLMFWIWENSLHYGPNSKNSEKNVHDFIFGIYSVILCMGLGLSRVVKKSVYLSSSWRFCNISSDTYFWLLGRNYLIYLANLHRKSLKTISISPSSF
jgi:hypothetical protein